MTKMSLITSDLAHTKKKKEDKYTKLLWLCDLEIMVLNRRNNLL